MGLVKNVKTKKDVKPFVELTLPTEKSVPVSDLGGYSLLLYGKKKIGKTTLASRFPDALFLMFEPGAKAISVYQRTVNNWTEFKTYVNLIVKDKKFKTVVIDPADLAYDYCLRYACKKQGIEHPSDAGWGKGWAAVKQEFNMEFGRLLKCGKGIIFISHAREEEIEERSGKKYHRRTSTMSGQAKEAIEGVIDMWFNYDYRGRERILTILGDDFIDAGHRLNEEPDARFLYTNGKPIRELNMGTNSAEAYEVFLQAFRNELVDMRKEGGKPKPTLAKKKVLLKKT